MTIPSSSPSSLPPVSFQRASQRPVQDSAKAPDTGDAAQAPPPLSPTERAALAAAVRTAPVIPTELQREPAVAALADKARQVLARGTGRAPEDVEVEARVLPGSGDRVVLFRDTTGRTASLSAGDALAPAEAHGLSKALADINVIAGFGMGFRIIPSVMSVGALPTLGHFSDREGLARHVRIGASTPVASGAHVWEVKEGLKPVGPSMSLSVPYVSAGPDPLFGDRVELSIPGYVTVLAAVKEGKGRSEDMGWLGVVWHHGLTGVGPGPTVITKLVVGHPALAGPLRPAVAGAAAVVSPIMARINNLIPES